MALIAFRAMMPGVLASPPSATAAKDRRRLASAPCVVREDLGAGFGPPDLVELVSVVRVHFEGPSFRPFLRCVTLTTSRRIPDGHFRVSGANFLRHRRPAA